MTDRYEKNHAALAHEIWAAAQLVPGEGIVDGVARVEALLRKTPHPAITHCDNCGCDWLDNGLNPIGCPYCKLTASVDEAKETDLWRCTVCRRVGTVGRCCGEETRERANMGSLQAEIEALRAKVEWLQEIVRPKREDECLTLDHWRMRAYYLEANWSLCSHACAIEQTKREQAEARAERLAEALRELEEREQRDEALLRQALSALERGAWDTLRGRNAAADIRERLGESPRALSKENSND